VRVDYHGLPPIEEIKHTPDGRAQAFTCGRLDLSRGRAVVLFVTERELRGDGYVFPPGSRTFGFFWSRRPYNCYRMHGPDGALIAHRFDVVDSVRIRPDRIEYRDLLLDVWVPPGGAAAVEDEDEVWAAQAAGLLTPAQLRRIQRARTYLLTRHGRIIAEVAAVLAALGVSPAGP
jgi:predicted RNA-binding protein associated with RNAse of E/G family